MGYFDFEARFDVALFDRTSFDYLFGLGVNLPLSASVSIPRRLVTVSIPERITTMITPNRNVTVMMSSSS
jgi:hypothetical protein